MTDLRGVETHGVSNMLRAYVRDYQAGKLDPRPGWRVVRESPATAVIDAERRLGVIVGPKAMRLAVDKARAAGVGVVTVFNSGHFGAIGHYAMQAAAQDMVGVCFTGAGLSVVPTFATKPLLGTNPIALAAPARHEAPMLFDAATSAIAGNKIRLAMRVGSPLLPGWVTDKDGIPIMEEKPVFDRGRDAQDPAHGDTGAGPGARPLSGPVGGRRGPEPPGQRYPAPPRGAAVVRRVHEPAGPRATGTHALSRRGYSSCRAR
jgi:LDH2 family malate/lactate/ureidoglycolate dehydrogenase